MNRSLTACYARMTSHWNQSPYSNNTLNCHHSDHRPLSITHLDHPMKIQFSSSQFRFHSKLINVPLFTWIFMRSEFVNEWGTRWIHSEAIIFICRPSPLPQQIFIIFFTINYFCFARYNKISLPTVPQNFAQTKRNETSQRQRNNAILYKRVLNFAP